MAPFLEMQELYMGNFPGFNCGSMLDINYQIEKRGVGITSSWNLATVLSKTDHKL